MAGRQELLTSALLVWNGGPEGRQDRKHGCRENGCRGHLVLGVWEQKVWRSGLSIKKITRVSCGYILGPDNHLACEHEP